MDILTQVALRIIKEQELIIGPLAWIEAGKVVGIKIINRNSSDISIENNDKTSVVDMLVKQYERLFGRASREVCKEAAAPLLKTMSPSDIPSSLQ